MSLEVLERGAQEGNPRLGSAGSPHVDIPLNAQKSWMFNPAPPAASPVQLASANPDAAGALFGHMADGPEVTRPTANPQTQPTAAPGAQAPTLTDKIARSIAIFETNRGGNAPIARESSLDTTAGIHASVRSVSQATAPWILQALQAHPELRQNASQPVTQEQITAARGRMTSTDQLLSSVDRAGNQTAEQFAATHAQQLAASGMTEADVSRMMQGRDLHQELLAATARVNHLPRNQREAAIRREANAIPEDQRVGMGTGSISSYIRNPKNWGENRAAWERMSIERMDDGVGNRIMETATHNDGLSMMSAVMGSQVSSQQRAHPGNSDAVVRGVAGQHNRDPAYPGGVLNTYHRLYPGR